MCGVLPCCLAYGPAYVPAALFLACGPFVAHGPKIAHAPVRLPAALFLAYGPAYRPTALFLAYGPFVATALQIANEKSHLIQTQPIESSQVLLRLRSPWC